MSAFLPMLGSSERPFARCWKTTLTAVAAIGLCAGSASAEEPAKINPDNVAKSISVKPKEAWKILIVPGPGSPAVPAPRIELVSHDATAKSVAAAVDPAVVPDPLAARRNEPRVVNPDAYREIYNAIPFNRTEYRANPDYRHEATMEMLFGQLRPKVVVRMPSPFTEYRVTHTQQSIGRPGGFAPPLMMNPMLSPNYWSW